MLTIRAMSNGSGYSARHLQHSDYYAEGERITGLWQGRGAELLRLSGEVQAKQFEALRQGLDPKSGEFLRQRHSADRIAADGTTQSHGRNLYDFTFSAPKSVSIMAELEHDARLADAHRNAVKETLRELEDCAATRVRMEGANDNRATGNLVLAVYHHDTSRELDPQLHTHAVAANLTYDGHEGRWKALQASGIYEKRAYLTEVYRNALAREVRNLGYEIEDRRGPKGKDLGFEIKGISDELLGKYSQRSEQRDKAIAEFIEVNNRKPTDNEVAILVRESRAEKLVEISTAQVHLRQQARLMPDEKLALEQVCKTALAASRTQQYELNGAAPSLNYAEEHIFERVSVAVEHQLLTEALRHGRGQIDLGQLKAELALQEASREILRAGQEVATRASLDREREMIARINRGVGQFERLGGKHECAASDRLGPEQQKAVQFVLDSRDLAVNLRGAAGTGKTATLEEINRGLRESGLEVLATAPTMSAVEELQRVGFSEAVTLERLLQNQAIHGGLHDKVVLVDEAGMVSGRQMSELLKLAQQQSARIVFSGDTKQIRSVEASDALRILEKESELKSVSLTGVQRQTSLDYREAVRELRRDPESGFDKLEAMGAIREVPWQDRARAVQQAYFETMTPPNANGQARQVLVVAPTHDHIGQITEAIRAERTRRGELGQSVRFEHHIPLNWTIAEKRDLRNYREGQVLKFHRAAKDIERNETLHAVRVDGNQLIAKNLKGDQVRVMVGQARCFGVYERRTIEVAPSDRLLLMSNRRDPNFRATNGELVTVSRVDERNRIHLRDGRVLPEDYKQFSHGYAVTAHRSQGKSVDRIVISGDGMRKELFYVAASRGRESITIVSSDRDTLRETIARSDIRQSASDLALKARSRCLEHNATSLRERYQSYSIGQERKLGTSEESNQPSIESFVGKAGGMYDQNQATYRSTHEQLEEPSHSLGMSR